MRIVYCIPALNYSSGMERVLSIKANYLADVYGYDIHILVTEPGGENSYFPISDKVKIHNLEINFDKIYKKSFLARSVLFFYKQKKHRIAVDRALRGIKPDITVSLLRRDVSFIGKIKDGSVKIGEMHFNRLNYRKINVNIPHLLKRCIENIWMKRLIKQLKRLSCLVVLTKADAALWKEIPNVKVIYNPLPFMPDKVSDLKNKEVIAVGRYTPQKGFDYLIDAWKIVSQKHPDWRLSIYGEGHLKESLQNKIYNNGITESCRLMSPVRNIADKYCESSLFTLSSRFEGFGVVLIEAMACGLPCVSFDCNFGPTDIINPGKDGLLAKSGDTNDLAQKICSLIENDDMRKYMSINAIENAKRFGQDNIMNQWHALFSQLLDTSAITSL